MLVERMPQISSQAIVEKGACLGADVRVGPFCYIGPQVEIAAGCVIENNATIVGKCVLGERTHVYPLAVVGAPAEDGADGSCILGKANVIREQVTIYAGQNPTRIGNDNLIMIGSAVGPGAVVGDHGIFANGTLIGPDSTIEDYVRSSAFVVVEEGNTVGAYTFVAGYAAINRDAPPFAIVQGSPFRVRGINAENLRRCGFDEEDIRKLKDAFRSLFDGADGQVNSTALQKCQASTNPHLRRLAQALTPDRSAKRKK